MKSAAMLAAYAAAQDPESPLSGLEVGERPEPDVPDGWELVTVRAATLNHHDLWSLRGVGLPEERLPMILGCDAAGVTADGREVVLHAVVDDEQGWSIFSERHQGTFAERVAVPRANLLDKPAKLSFAEAACLPTAYLTAYRMLFVRGALRPGQRVLIQGAGGGVATAAILLAAGAGIEVTVTSRDEGRLERARELGAHVTLGSGERVPNRVDVVIETVGKATWKHSIRSVAEHGKIVVAGATSGFDPSAELRHVYYRQLDVLGSTMGTRDELRDLVNFLAVTQIRPVIDSERPLSEARDAFARMEAGEEFGKLALTSG
ncbi:MAG TPA: zinc-binding dehydrogenase [Solirubrobacteraceae bacterium]